MDFSTTVEAEDSRPVGPEGHCTYCGAPIGADHKAECVIISIRRFDALPVSVWLTMDSYADGNHALFYWPQGERGIGGMETATLYRSDHGHWFYWTHGGPNGGMDFEPRNDERPTAWMRLPPHPV